MQEQRARDVGPDRSSWSVAPGRSSHVQGEVIGVGSGTRRHARTSSCHVTSSWSLGTCARPGSGSRTGGPTGRTGCAAQPSSRFNTIAPVPPGTHVERDTKATAPLDRKWLDPHDVRPDLDGGIDGGRDEHLDVDRARCARRPGAAHRCRRPDAARATDRHPVAGRASCRPAPRPPDHRPGSRRARPPVVGGQPDDLGAPGQSIVGFGAAVHPLERDPVVAHATRGTGPERDRQHRGLAGSDTEARHDRAIGGEHRCSDGFGRVEPGRSRLGQPDRLEREPKRGRRGTVSEDGAAPDSTWTGTATTGRSMASSTVPPASATGFGPMPGLGPHRSEVKVERRPARRRRRTSGIGDRPRPRAAACVRSADGGASTMSDDELAAGFARAVRARHRPIQTPGLLSLEPPMTGRSHRPGPGAGARLPPNRSRSE